MGERGTTLGKKLLSRKLHEKNTYYEAENSAFNMSCWPNDNRLAINERKSESRFRLRLEKKKGFGAEIAYVGELVYGYRMFVSSIMRRCIKLFY